MDNELYRRVWLTFRIAMTCLIMEKYIYVLLFLLVSKNEDSFTERSGVMDPCGQIWDTVYYCTLSDVRNGNCF